MEVIKVNPILEKVFKQIPEDFKVYEKVNLKPLKKGPYEIFILEKRCISTLEAIEVISKFFNIPKNKIGYAGLKDKFAVTWQYISIPQKYKVKECIFVKRNNKWIISKVKKPYYFSLKFFCYSKTPLLLGKLKGNLFEITLRNLNKSLKEKVSKNLNLRKEIPFPNYYGEQRFGTIKGRKDFMYSELLKGNFEKALKIYYLGSASLENITWEDILELQKERLEEYEKDMLKKLIKGYDIEKALNELPKRIKLLWAFALQSIIWNEVLRLFIEKNLKFKRVEFFEPYFLSYNLNFKKEFKNLEIPFLGYKYIPQEDIKILINKVLEKFGISEKDFEKEILGVRFLEDNVRKAFILPKNLKILNQEKDKITFEIFLPSGSYASIFVRGLLI